MQVNRDYVSKKNTYAGQNRPKYIVIHETDNYSKGAGARRHAEAQASGDLSTSVHYYAGDDGVYQAAEHTDGTYSIGVEYGGGHGVKDATNRNTVNIEICVNVDGDYTKARANAVGLVKHLIQAAGIPADRVIRHYDAKGKYCPRKMMDDLSLWEDFKRQVGHVVNEDPAQGADKGKETWYRVGAGWKDGICQGQTGAYRNKDFAIADCRPGQYVFDEEGNVLYTGGGASGSRPDAGYSQRQFILDVQKAIGSKQDGVAGDETLGNTVTVSRNSNKYHAVVTPLERRLKALGYYSGEVEADGGGQPCFGKGMETSVSAYQKKVLGYKEPDGEVTARKKMWKSLLGMV